MRAIPGHFCKPTLVGAEPGQITMPDYPPFKYDLFISYAHKDDEPDPELSSGVGWVSMLVKRLRKKLGERLERSEEFTLWRDEQLRGHIRFTPEILGAVRQSATLLIVLSTRYLSSEWCQLELKTFLEAADGLPDAVPRVFVVERDPDARSRRPAALSDALGYEFWDVGDDKVPFTLGDPVANPKTNDGREYFRILNKLTYELSGAIKSLRPQPGAAPEIPPPDDRPCVFLALTSDDLNKQRRAVEESFKQAEVRVFPESRYPVSDLAQYREQARRDVERCRLFVQLLSDEPGPLSPEVPGGHPLLQYELAVALGKPLYQWRTQFDPNGVADAAYRALLERPTVRVDGSEGIEEFKSAVIAAAKAPPPQPESPRPTHSSPGTPTRLVCIKAQKADIALTEPIQQLIVERNLGCFLPELEGTPKEIEAEIKALMARCHGLMVVYGTSHQSWVQVHALEPFRMDLPGRPPVIGILQAPPPPLKDDLRLRVPNMHVFQGPGDPRLVAFLDAVAAGGQP
jgi:TIR domain